MAELTEQERTIIRECLTNGEVTRAFTTCSFKVAVGLVGKGYMKQYRNLSPWHDTFKFTREGRRIARLVKKTVAQLIDNKADADLIAAAPKMYKALKMMLDNSELDPENPKRAWQRATPSNNAVVKAFQALALAEGKEVEG